MKNRGSIKEKIGKIEVICKYCGKIFFVWPSKIKRGGGKYCSHECYGKDHVGEKNGFFGKKHKSETIEYLRLIKIGSKDSIETKNKKRVANLKRYEDPKEHERTSEANRKRFEDPKQHEIQKLNQLKAFERDPDFKERSIQTLKNIVKTPEHKKNIGIALRGNKNGWKGGISFEPYCPKFNERFKERVRAFFGYKCQFPGCNHIWVPGEIRMAVHHANYEKMACCDSTIKPIFVPVRSRGCHSKTNNNREYWEDYFTNLINEEYGGKSYYTENEMLEYEKNALVKKR